MNAQDPRNWGALNPQEKQAKEANLAACRESTSCISDVNRRYDKLRSDRAESTLTSINAIRNYESCGTDVSCIAGSVAQMRAVRADLLARGETIDQGDVIALNVQIVSATSALGKYSDGSSALADVLAGMAIASAGGGKGPKVVGKSPGASADVPGPSGTSGGEANRATGSALQRDLAIQAKVQPDKSRDAEYLAKTDPSVMKDNNFDMNHVLAGEINAGGKATGYHAEFAAEGAARIRPGSPVTKNTDGTYSAQVDVFDPQTSKWVEKKTNEGKSTFFDPSWSEAKINYEVSEAFKNRAPSSNGDVGLTPSGVKIQFYVNSNRTTFYPLGN